MKSKNSISDLCELGVRTVDAGNEAKEFHCIAELRFTVAELPIGDDDCEVKISQATIVVDLEGLEPKPGTRIGEPKKNNAVELTKTMRKDVSSQFSRHADAAVQMSLAAFGTGANANVAFDATTSNNATIEAREKQEFFRVRALPNLVWKVSEYDGAALSDTYLSEDTLLTVNKSDRANRCSVTTSVKVKQRHIEIKAIGPRSMLKKLSTNQKRLLDIFIAKSLSAAVSAGGSYRGEIKLSETLSEVFGEG